MSRREGFTVDQLNNMIETIIVNVRNENMNRKALLDYIYKTICSF